MANRYWVGGTADWNATAGTKWSLTSGGAGGEAVPTSSDDVFFNASSGVNTITVTSAVNCNSLNCSNFSGTLANNFSISVYGNLILSATMTTSASGTGTIAFKATSGTNTITTNGLTLNYGLAFQGTGGTWQLQDNLALHYTKSLTIQQGTFDANDFSVTSGYISATGTSTRVISMGSGLWTINGRTGALVNCFDTTNLTLNKETANIKLAGALTGDVEFIGGGLTYNDFWNATTGNYSLTIRDNNTFGDFKVDAGRTVKFTDGTTQIVSSLTAIGTSTSNITLTGTSSVGWIISDTSGTNNCMYLILNYSQAAGGADFNAIASTNGVNNFGWNFLSTYPAEAGLLFLLT